MTMMMRMNMMNDMSFRMKDEMNCYLSLVIIIDEVYVTHYKYGILYILSK